MQCTVHTVEAQGELFDGQVLPGAGPWPWHSASDDDGTTHSRVGRRSYARHEKDQIRRVLESSRHFSGRRPRRRARATPPPRATHNRPCPLPNRPGPTLGIWDGRPAPGADSSAARGVRTGRKELICHPVWKSHTPPCESSKKLHPRGGHVAYLFMAEKDITYICPFQRVFYLKMQLTP